jgi:hypothetical protein
MNITATVTSGETRENSRCIVSKRSRRKPTYDDHFTAFAYLSGDADSAPKPAKHRWCSPVFWMKHRLRVKLLMKRQHPNRASYRGVIRALCGYPPWIVCDRKEVP